MLSDPLGIRSGYLNAFGKWRETSDRTRAAIRHAMRADEERACKAGRCVRVVLQGRSAPAPGRGELHLEDGGRVPIGDILPADLPLGYHELHAEGENRPIRVIVSPGQCWLPEGFQVWGWVAMLWSVRSALSWGMGDLRDLRELAAWSNQLGAEVVMINPLSAVAPILPQESSPYSPSSRRFRNPLYLHIEDVPGARQLGSDLERLVAAGRALSDEPLINRDPIFCLKMEALERIWHSYPPGETFDQFCREMGEPLHKFATFCTISEQYGSDYRKWPQEYRHPLSPAVGRFATANDSRVRFHQWLQWLLDHQLAAASAQVRIMQDLPIGFSPGGADAWEWQDLLAENVSIGAPPDVYNTQGQSWGLPPFVPYKLQDAGYEPFIQTIRSALRHAGGLRIDHVVGLFRKFWVPDGMSAADGTYVEYPAEDLLAILALESYRAKSVIVGEDLGTSGEDVAAMLPAFRVLSYRLMWFEETLPELYPPLALAAVSTHDLPTIAGLWSGHDLEEQERLGVEPNVQGMIELREKLRSLTGLEYDVAVETVIDHSYRRLAEAPSAILVATLEDAVAMRERPNIPNTSLKRPNWTLPLPVRLEQLIEHPLALTISKSLASRNRIPEYRNQPRPESSPVESAGG